MTHVATHSIKAYANSKKLTLLEAFRECYAGFTYGFANYTILPSDNQRIMKDVDVYNRKGIITSYVLKWLEHERIRQMQEFARAGPTLCTEPMFI